MAKGSKTCIVCGKPVRVTVDNCQFNYDHTTQQATAWHTNCRKP